MNQEKIGKFIAQCRKEKKLTQCELAEKLGVTDRAISNWENGKNIPELSLFSSICKELDITINELISGERIEKNKCREKFEDNMILINLENLKNKSSDYFKNIGIISLIISILTMLIIIGFIVIKEIGYKTVKVDNSNLNISLCDAGNNNIALLTNHVDGSGMYYIENTDVINSKVNIVYYRYLREMLNPKLINFSTGIVFIEDSYKYIYVNDKLVWNKNDLLKECKFNQNED